ncbi:hypothetical protein BJV82DRAFT_607830 [Fennellomyces sp. T-0311]|nr:hypothetical protein BJV82DRAFT_607830 [Fennellomyces sp. T-0311]
MRGNGPGRLSRSLEHRVADGLAGYKEAGNTDLSVSTLYEYLQKTDVSLRRQKKKQLETIIEKVLADFEQEERYNYIFPRCRVCI